MVDDGNLPGDPDLLRREIRNHMVGPFAGCARVKGTFRNPELAVVFIKFRPIQSHGEAAPDRLIKRLSVPGRPQGSD